jgi:hypothetical protein
MAWEKLHFDLREYRRLYWLAFYAYITSAGELGIYQSFWVGQAKGGVTTIHYNIMLTPQAYALTTYGRRW